MERIMGNPMNKARQSVEHVSKDSDRSKAEELLCEMPCWDRTCFLPGIHVLTWRGWFAPNGSD